MLDQRTARAEKKPAIVSGDIVAAARRIGSAILQTPCAFSESLSELTGMQVYCKLEYLQRTGSFKERGARNALMLIPPVQARRGVVAASAGNHALGLAYHGKLLGISVTVVMPENAPMTKIINCERFGARVVLQGRNIGECQQYAARLVEQDKSTYINGYNDPEVIAGQGTMGLEILQQVPDLDAVIVPVGGAGLIAGVATAIKKSSPEVKIIGVEPKHAASFAAAMQAGRPVLVQLQATLADGLAVPKVGSNGFEIARHLIDKYLLVEESEIAQAILRLLELEKSVVEGAGATPLAACLSGRLPELSGKKVVLPLCGGNIDATLLGRILERGLVTEGRLCRLSLVISDKPGGLAEFTRVVAAEGANIVDISHERTFAQEDLSTVRIYCTIETRDAAHIHRLKERLDTEGFGQIVQEGPAGHKNSAT